MAGAGYKLFNTGDVLTAAQVNTYLMEQTVMVFADAAARTTALTGVVSEGMISYLKDTNAVEVYNGSAWVSSDDPNAIQNTIVDAKGDLITATAADTPARLAVGNNGETLVADGSATTGLRWQSNFAAGKNKIINGDFGIWQRGTSFANVASGSFSADRWRNGTNNGDGTVAASQEAFTPGTAPVAGYESSFFHRNSVTNLATATGFFLAQRIEDVRTFAGQTITISFYAKADSARTLEVAVQQNFGSGGSATLSVSAATFTLTTAWQRYSVTYAVPSVSGKTIGAGSFIAAARFILDGASFSNTTVLDLWGVQVEAGSVATAFQTATGTLAGELDACKRYFERFSNDGGATGSLIAMGYTDTTTSALIGITTTEKRVNPTITFSAASGFQVNSSTASAISSARPSKKIFRADVTGSGFTAGQGANLRFVDSSTGTIDVSAEL